MRSGTRRWKSAGVSILLLAAAATVVFALTTAIGEEPAAGESATARDPQADEGRVSLAVARDRAKVMQEIYSATLDVVHERYFHRDRAVVPAKAMEDIFHAVRRRSKAEARWISVNLPAMSVHHEPKTDFEKLAAKEIAAGKIDLETVEEGYYRRATPIAMASECVQCHSGFPRNVSTAPKFAGLVVSIPVERKVKKSDLDSSNGPGR